MKLLNLLIPGFGRPRWKIYLWLGWTGIVTGSGFLLVAIGLASYEAFFLAHSSETQGTVVANVESKIAANQETQTPAHTDYCPEFEYQSTDGVTHKVTGSCSDPPSFTIGERVRVKYANWDYDNGQIDSVGDQWGFVIAFGLIAVVLMPIGFVLLRRVCLQGHSLDPIGFWDPD
jgi:hypothetical protein